MTPLQWTEAQPIAGMIPWTCSFQKPDGLTYGITLYGTDQDQILEDNCTELPGLTIEGKLMCTADANLDEGRGG